MRHFFIIFAVLFTACRQPAETSLNESPDQTNPVNREHSKISSLTYQDITNKVFETGDKIHFTDSCTFYFECDCCSGIIVLNSDSTFVTQDHCLDTESACAGTFKINGSILTLNYTGPMVSTTYKSELDMDSTATDYFYHDTLIQPASYNYKAYTCGQKLILQQQNGTELMTVTEAKYEDVFSGLKKDNFIDRLNKLQLKAAKPH